MDNDYWIPNGECPTTREEVPQVVDKGRSPIYECLRDFHFINTGIILLFITGGIARVVWERLSFQDCVLEYSFVGGEEFRERKVDDRC